MLRTSSLSAAILAMGILIAPATSRADATQAEATAMRTSINGFILQFAGLPAIADMLTPVVTPEGDHLRLAFAWEAIGPIVDYSLSAGAITANARSLGGGRWAIDDLRFPNKLVAGGDKAGYGVTITLGEQSGNLIFDPALATSSTLDMKLRGLSVISLAPQGASTQRRETVEIHAVWQPRGDGRIDMRTDMIETGYAIGIPTQGGTPINVMVDRLTSKTELKNIALIELGALIQDALALGRKPETIGVMVAGMTKPSKDMLAMARRGLGVLAGLMDGIDAESTATGIHIQAGNMDFGVKKLAVALHTGAADGALQANMPISVEGLDLGELVKGPLKEVLPQRISLTPTVGGIDKGGLFAMLRQAVDGKLADPAAWQAAIEKLLISNPVTFTIDDLVADFGLAKLEGAGEIEVASATEVTGRAELRATGLDALIRRANVTPELKMVAPILIFLKGIGEPDGREMVWRVAFSDGKLSVNDTQLSDILPGK